MHGEVSFYKHSMRYRKSATSGWGHSLRHRNEFISPSDGWGHASPISQGVCPAIAGGNPCDIARNACDIARSFPSDGWGSSLRYRKELGALFAISQEPPHPPPTDIARSAPSDRWDRPCDIARSALAMVGDAPCDIARIAPNDCWGRSLRYRLGGPHRWRGG